MTSKDACPNGIIEYSHPITFLSILPETWPLKVQYNKRYLCNISFVAHKSQPLLCILTQSIYFDGKNIVGLRVVPWCPSQS